MSSLAIKFLASILSIFGFFMYIVIFNSSPSKEYENSVSQISALVKIPNISNSTPYVENRIKEYDDYSNNFYLGMKKETYLGFTYAK